ncbi:MAG: FG-GAP-like repeat-containing protein [Acidobacteriota bacterium]
MSAAPDSRRIAMLGALALAGVVTLAAAPPAGVPAPKATPVNDDVARRLDALAAAIRDGDAKRIAAFFRNPALVNRMPERSSKEREDVKDIRWHGFRLEGAGSWGQVEIEAGWQGFLAHFAAIESCRLDLSEASFPDAKSGRGKIALSIAGRDHEGRREWVRATSPSAAFWRADAAHDWLIAEMPLDAMESMLSQRDFWTEIAEPAGVSAPPSRAARGAAAGDVDGNGTIDLVVAGPDRCTLYLNDGSGRFRDATSDAGLAGAAGAAPLLLDVDNDGDLDLFIASSGAQKLLENRRVPDGKAVFRDISRESGIASGSGTAFSATAGDVNGDGRPDIYVACGGDETRPSGTPNLLFVSQADGRYSEEAKKLGVDDPRSSRGTDLADITGDGTLDLLVASASGDGALFVRSGDRFFDEARSRGALVPSNGSGAALGDFDDNGIVDLLAMSVPPRGAARPEGNVLLRGAANGKLSPMPQNAGGLPPAWSWSGALADADGDGWPDVITSTGFALNVDGKRLLDASGMSGIDGGAGGRAAVLADLDNDGDLDLFVTAVEGSAHRLYRNDLGGSHHLRIGVSGTKSGRDAFGAVVRAKTSRGIQTIVKTGGEALLSQHDPRLLFGLGEDAEAEWVEVTWPSGAKDRIEHVASGSSILIAEGGKVTPVSEKKASLPDPLTPEERLERRLRVRVGQRFPDLSLSWFDGKTAPLSSKRPKGGKLLVTLWDSACAPCAGQLAELSSLSPAAARLNIAIAAISFDASAATAKSYVSSHRLAFPIAAGTDATASAIATAPPPPMPLSVLVDEKGNVEGIWERLDPSLRAILGGMAMPGDGHGRRVR